MFPTPKAIVKVRNLMRPSIRVNASETDKIYQQNLETPMRDKRQRI
jgi:hypothetical protein